MAYELITKYKNENFTSYITLGLHVTREMLNNVIRECGRIRGRKYEYCKLVHTDESKSKKQEVHVNVDNPQISIHQLLNKVHGIGIRSFV
jgi:hypothetical protein